MFFIQHVRPNTVERPRDSTHMSEISTNNEGSRRIWCGHPAPVNNKACSIIPAYPPAKQSPSRRCVGKLHFPRSKPTYLLLLTILPPLFMPRIAVEMSTAWARHIHGYGSISASLVPPVCRRPSPSKSRV